MINNRFLKTLLLGTTFVVATTAANAAAPDLPELPSKKSAASALPDPALLEEVEFVDEVTVSTPVATEAASSQPMVGESVVIGQGFFLQLGAFKEDVNSNKLSVRMQEFDRPVGVDIFNLYDEGVFRVKMGPYATRAEAESAAALVQKQYQIKPIIQDQI